MTCPTVSTQLRKDRWDLNLDISTPDMFHPLNASLMAQCPVGPMGRDRCSTALSPAPSWTYQDWLFPPSSSTSMPSKMWSFSHCYHWACFSQGLNVLQFDGTFCLHMSYKMCDFSVLKIPKWKDLFCYMCLNRDYPSNSLYGLSYSGSNHSTCLPVKCFLFSLQVLYAGWIPVL